jgi:Protein of unknown function (DUF3089)
MLFALTVTFSSLVPLAAATAATVPVRWICPPTGPASCSDVTTTELIPVTGPTVTSTFRPQVKPVADCFFLYPTMSPAPFWNAPNRSTPLIRASVRAMAIPFTQTCRLVVPVYQQVTSAHLAVTTPTAQDRAAIEVAYQSVLRAWRAYLQATPSTRPVVLVGFSQGAGMLSQLLRREIAPDPHQFHRVILSELVGGGLTVTSPRSSNDGLAGIALCHHLGQIRCAIAYDAFSAPPPTYAIVGRPGAPWGYLSAWTPAQGFQMACVNPIYGGRQSGALTPYFGGNPYTTYPNRFRAACERLDGIDWLNIRQINAPGVGGPHNAMPSLDPGATTSSVGLHGESWGLTLGNLVLSARAAVSVWTLRP